MGSTFILVGASALGTGLVSLICGYFWGRSNVRSQIEDALDKARVSADAREFSVREELDEKMVELASLRAQAEEVPRLREQLETLKQEFSRSPSAGRSNMYAQQNSGPLQMTPEKPPEPAPAPESADKAIQNLLKSIEERMKQGDEVVSVPFPASPPAASTFAAGIPSAVTQPIARPAAVQVPAPIPAPVRVPAAKPAVTARPAATPPKPTIQAKPAAPPNPVAPASSKDEWQEFAASLDALRNRQK